MELLKALFENADLPAEFKTKTATLFEAAVDERVKAEVASLVESFDAKLAAATTAFITEATKTVDSVVEETVLEWAKENAVALDSQVKGQIAESFLTSLKGVFEKADIEINGGTAGVELTKLQEANAVLVKAAEASKVALVEAEGKLVSIKRAEILKQVTEGLADTQAHRVAKLVEAFDFKSEADFRSKAAMVVEAVSGKPAPVAVNHDGDGTPIAVPAGGKNTPQIDIPAGSTGNEDGELVVKPTGTAVISAQGADGKPVATKVITQPGLDGNTTPHMIRDPQGKPGNGMPGNLKEQVELLHGNAAPHLHSDLIAETLKLFK